MSGTVRTTADGKAATLDDALGLRVNGRGGCQDPQHGAQSNISAGNCLTAASEYPLESSHNNAAQKGVEG